MNTTQFVIVLVLGILAVLALIWIPIIVWLRRRGRTVAARHNSMTLRRARLS